MSDQRHCGKVEPGSHSDDYPCPSLNFDILHLVCNCLTDIPDVLSFSLICSTLREGALQRRLRMSPVVLHLFGVSIGRFHSFVFQDVGGRAPHIYGLKLSDWDYKFPINDFKLQINDTLDEMSRRLVDLLEAAINLEYLYLSDIDLPHIVLAVVEKLTTLRHLSMCPQSCTVHPFKLLTTLRSPLEYLRIRSVHGIHSLPASFLHHQMAHFASTLEILDLDNLALDISPFSATSQFTALRTLKVVSINLDQLEVLLRTFPNLDNSLELNFLDHDLTPTATFPAVRERNKEVQKVHTWPGLDRLTCYITIAFVLALQCPVRRMDIHPVFLPEEARYLVETLRSNAPRQLRCGLSLFDGLQGLDGLFPSEAAGRDKLTHLVVFVRLPFDGPWEHRGDISSIVPWDQALDGLLQSMQHLHTTHLRIVLQYHTHHDDTLPEGPQTEAQLDGCRKLYTASEGDLARAAARFFSSMAALRYLFLTTCGYITVESKTDICRQRLLSQAWCAVDSNLYPSEAGGESERGWCTAMSSETAEAVMDQEELRLGSNDEDMVRFCGAPESPPE